MKIILILAFCLFSIIAKGQYIGYTPEETKREIGRLMQVGEMIEDDGTKIAAFYHNGVVSYHYYISHVYESVIDYPYLIWEDMRDYLDFHFTFINGYWINHNYYNPLVNARTTVIYRDFPRGDRVLLSIKRY